MTMQSTPSPAAVEELLPGGGHCSFVLRRGQMLRLTDLEGGANVAALFYNAHENSSSATTCPTR